MEYLNLCEPYVVIFFLVLTDKERLTDVSWPSNVLLLSLWIKTLWLDFRLLMLNIITSRGCFIWNLWLSCLSVFLLLLCSYSVSNASSHFHENLFLNLVCKSRDFVFGSNPLWSAVAWIVCQILTDPWRTMALLPVPIWVKMT